MNKEEILEQSRKSQTDEGMLMAEQKGRTYGYIAFVIAFVIIIFVNLFYGLSSYAPMAMFWAFCAAVEYPKYKFTNQKSYLISTILSSIACIAFLLSFLLVTLR